MCLWLWRRVFPYFGDADHVPDSLWQGNCSREQRFHFLIRSVSVCTYASWYCYMRCSMLQLCCMLCLHCLRTSASSTQRLPCWSCPPYYRANWPFVLTCTSSCRQYYLNYSVVHYKRLNLSQVCADRPDAEVMLCRLQCWARQAHTHALGPCSKMAVHNACAIIGSALNACSVCCRRKHISNGRREVFLSENAVVGWMHYSDHCFRKWLLVFVCRSAECSATVQLQSWALRCRLSAKKQAYTSDKK